MGQVRHGSATTTHVVRAAIQRSQTSLAQLSKELGINPKTVAKWRKRSTVEDLKTGPKKPRSTVLTEAEEAMIVAFRRHTLLPMDDCLYALQPSIPHLSRSALHRCLQRHGISRLPDVEGDKPKRQKFKRYPIGYFHIDIAEVQTAEGKLYLFVGIDRTSKFAVTRLVEKADRKTAWEFLEHLLKTVPYRIHTILTDNGIQFAEQPRNRNTAYSRQMRFDMICEANGIEHRLTKPNHPWTNGQVERMNRTIKEATVKRYHYDNHDQLRTHLADLMAAYNFARRLKTLSGLTPYEYICKIWTSEPERFNLNPIHQMPGLNTYGSDGHVWAGAMRDMTYAVTGQGGYIYRLGDPEIPDGLLAEVYTFPASAAQNAGDVALSVETELGNNNCGLEIEAQTLQTFSGKDITSRDLSLSVLDCDAAGNFLVLNNLFEDLKVAAIN